MTAVTQKLLGPNGHDRSNTGPNSRPFFAIDGRWIAQTAIAGRDWRDGVTGHFARDRDLETRSGHAESFDCVSTNTQWHALAPLACVDPYFLQLNFRE